MITKNATAKSNMSARIASKLMIEFNEISGNYLKSLNSALFKRSRGSAEPQY